MTERLALTSGTRAFRAPDGGVVLLALAGDAMFDATIYASVVALLDGTRTADDIVDALADRHPGAEVYYAIDALRRGGRLDDVRRQAEAEAGARRALAVATLVATLAPTTVAVVSDLLDAVPVPGDAASRAGHARLPVSVTEALCVVGPLLGDGSGQSCPRCLEQRMLVNRPLAAMVREHRYAGIELPGRLAPIPRWLAGAVGRELDAGGLSASMVSFDARGTVLRRHPVRRRPECDRCGRAQLYRERASVPVDLRRDDNLAAYARDDRVAAEFVRRHAELLDPLTGIARNVRRVDVPGGNAVHVYVGGANRARAIETPRAARRDLRRLASGKGRSDVAARASLIGELAERHSACHRGDEPRVTASLAALGAEAIHPNACMLFSERQLAMREVLSTASEPVPAPFDVEKPVEWTRVWSLTHRLWRYLPTAYLYFHCPRGDSPPSVIADSNGNAAGATLEAAILQGTLELIERDAVGIWWLNGAARTAAAIEDIDDPWLREALAQFARVGRETWLLDLTTDLDVPVFAAVSRRTDAPTEQIIFGFGAHVDGRVALARAVAELCQTLAVSTELAADSSRVAAPLRDWWSAATVARHAFLAPSGVAPAPRRLPDGMTVSDALESCRQRLSAAGMELLVLDQSRPDIGVPTVKVIVPGLRHYRRRLAPGRLFDVPRRLGWEPRAAREAELNDLVLAF